jgi:hypothetical protein
VPQRSDSIRQRLANRLLAAASIAASLLACTAAAQENQKPPAAVKNESAGDPAEIFEHAVHRARKALAARDLAAAVAQLQVAVHNARLPAQLKEVQQLQSLAEQLRLFFDAVRAGWQKFEPTEEIHVDGLVAAVVETRPDGVTLFIEGAKRDYTVATLPAKLALHFARAAADEQSPAAAVFFGAFQAVDPQGDRGQARQLWQRAAVAGADVDNLLPLLEGSPLAARREPVPDAGRIEAAGRWVQGQLAELIVKAENAPRRALVAARMLEASRRAQTAAEQYAALEQARDWAISAGDPLQALAAVEELADCFDVDGLELKSKALGAALAGPVSSQAAALAAAEAVDLSIEAERAGRGALALTLADTAYAAARKARDSELTKRAYRQRSEVQARLRKSEPRAPKPLRSTR